jgi:hypothetical protein
VSNNASGANAAALGGSTNVASGACSVVVGGEKNLAQAIAGFIGGGECNSVCNSTSGCLAFGASVVGGVGNNTTGGTWDLATCTFSVAPTICDAGQYSFLGGGFQNRATGCLSTISGGCCNTICCSTLSGVGSTTTFGSFIGGGVCNIIRHSASNCSSTNRFQHFLGGGLCNIAGYTTGSAYYDVCNPSVLVGGFLNQSIASSSFIGNGFCNITSGQISSIVNGVCNTASGIRSSIVNGISNTASGNCSFIGGGNLNTASCINSTIINGCSNTATSCFSFIGNGCGNAVSGIFSTIVGGEKNLAQAIGGFIGGGECNSVCNSTSGCLAYGAAVVGGVGNNTTGGTWSLASCAFAVAPTICNAGIYSFVGGGFQNIASSANSAVLGGTTNNTSTFDCAMIVGSNITADRACATFVNNLSIKNIPTSSAGLPSGSVWSNVGILNIVP